MFLLMSIKVNQVKCKLSLSLSLYLLLLLVHSAGFDLLGVGVVVCPSFRYSAVEPDGLCAVLVVPFAFPFGSIGIQFPFASFSWVFKC